MLYRLICVFAILLPTPSLVFSDEAGEGTTEYGEVADKLNSLQVLISKNNEARSELLKLIKKVDPAQSADLQMELDTLNSEQKNLRLTFEQVAIGSIDTAVFADVEVQFDWKEEITLILQPIVENLKALTDKPRKINHLIVQIEHRKRQMKLIAGALDTIERTLPAVPDTETKKSLEQVQRSWESRKESNLQDLALAETQLSGLQNSDVTWWQTLRQSAAEFFHGRGLTLLIALGVAVLIWLSMRALLWTLQLRAKKGDPHAFRTRKRLVEYGHRALMLVFIVVAVITVFYVRGDLLLLGLSMLATATLVIGLRQAVPQFISEAQLLLNIGSIREQERVIYNGLPWQVVSINMFSHLRNPELSGVLRLPLRDLAGLTSRPNTQEVWYPSSRGDFVLLAGESLVEVVKQTAEVVELRDLGGSFQTMSAADFYSLSFKNISRGETFGVASYFGIDYELQPLCLTDVPRIFREAIEEAFSKTDFAQSVTNVLVDFSSAGSSSLDYLIYVSVKSESAKVYSKVKRIIQQSCVAVCTKEGWGIPYPQLTIHQPDKLGVLATNHSYKS